MDIDKFGTFLVNNDWGKTMATGDNFYRLLFKHEKLKSLSISDIKSMFASYKNWKEEIDRMTSDCHRNSTMEDRKAIVYAETLVDDILRHIETIITTIPCEDKNFLKNLQAKVDEVQKMRE